MSVCSQDILRKLVLPLLDCLEPYFRLEITDPNDLPNADFVKRFVHFTTGKDACRTLVYPHINPKYRRAFLVHILLSFGHYSTGQYDSFSRFIL